MCVACLSESGVFDFLTDVIEKLSWDKACLLYFPIDKEGIDLCLQRISTQLSKNTISLSSLSSFLFLGYNIVWGVEWCYREIEWGGFFVFLVLIK